MVRLLIVYFTAATRYHRKQVFASSNATGLDLLKATQRLVFAVLLGSGIPIDALSAPPDDSPSTSSNTLESTTIDKLGSDFTIEGILTNRADVSRLKDIKVTLYAHRGLSNKLVRVTETLSDADGRYQFTNLTPPDGNRFNRLKYVITAQAEGGPKTYFPIDYRSMRRGNLGLLASVGNARGKIVDEQGSPVAGATVSLYGLAYSAELGLPSFTTKENGLFLLSGIPQIGPEKDQLRGISLMISHPSFVRTSVQLSSNAYSEIVLQPGCCVEGVLIEEQSHQPLAGQMISLVPYESMKFSGELFAATSEDGRYRFHAPEGKYKLMLESDELVAKAQILECRDGAEISAEPLLASAGGWMVGQVINTATGDPMIWTELGGDGSDRISLGLYGPNRPAGRLRYQDHLAVVDNEGRFRLRAFPGENFPYFCNLRGSRTAFNTEQQSPIIVTAGEETNVMMTYTPPPTADEKMAAARKVRDGLPKDLLPRVQGIIEEFRKLNHTVDECELWCLLMQELVSIGQPAVPALCHELEATNEQRMMRRLGFALRAIGDPRAVPSLIRALPKTLQPPMSDYGLIVNDAELMKFMQTHQMKPSPGQHFDFSRPVREIHAALYKITKHGESVETPLSRMSLSDDPRARIEQQRRYHSTAKRWADWWEENWKKFGVDESYSTVNLPKFNAPDLSDVPTGLTITPAAKLGSGSSQFVITPIGDKDHKAVFFLDLDIGTEPSWPDDLPRDSATPETVSQARAWAAEQGADLICVAATDDKGDTTYSLSEVDMQVWEIDKFDAKNLESLLKAGKLPVGRKLDSDLLLHRNEKTKSDESARDASFLYLTAQQGLGIITITDFVIEARDVTGQFMTQPGIGYHRGVRFDYRTIVR